MKFALQDRELWTLTTDHVYWQSGLFARNCGEMRFFALSRTFLHFLAFLSQKTPKKLQKVHFCVIMFHVGSIGQNFLHHFLYHRYFLHLTFTLLVLDPEQPTLGPTITWPILHPEQPTCPRTALMYPWTLILSLPQNSPPPPFYLPIIIAPILDPKQLLDPTITLPSYP